MRNLHYPNCCRYGSRDGLWRTAVALAGNVLIAAAVLCCVPDLAQATLPVERGRVPQTQETVVPSDVQPQFSGERLSLNFQDIDVRSLLQVIANFTGFNVVTSDTVTGTLTLRLKDVPWDQALEIILQAKGLGMTKNGNVLWIAPRDEIHARARKDFEAVHAMEKLEPLHTEIFQIHYAKAEELARQFSEIRSSRMDITGNHDTGDKGATKAVGVYFLSERGSMVAEPRTNQLFVTDTASRLQALQKLLAKLDIPVRQVLIEARIVEARDSFGHALGVKFGGAYHRPGRGSVGSGYGRPGDGDGWDGSGTSSGNPFVNLPAGLSTGDTGGTLALSIFNSDLTRFLSLELSAMEAEGVGKIISNPRLLTTDKLTAHIKQGTQIPYTPRGNTERPVETAFKEAVLKLEVTPQITPDGNILLELNVNKDTPGERTPDGIAIDTREIKTQVQVENGGTVVIGGIFEMEEIRQASKVPLLGDIPAVGHFFRNQTRESSKREMLVFITPSLVADVIAP